MVGLEGLIKVVAVFRKFPEGFRSGLVLNSKEN
jgi:hypothetical protein